MKKHYINEVAWSKIYMFLHFLRDIRVKNESKAKKFVEAIYWMSKTGAQWRELDSFYGKWNSIYKRFNAWSKKYVWENLLQFCIKNPDLECIMIDVTIVRAHACATGYGNQDKEGLERSKGGLTSKFHAKIDALGNSLKFIIISGQRNDCTQAALLESVYESEVMADKAYDSNDIHKQVADQNCNAVIPPRKNRIEQYDYDEFFYKERHVVECFFGKIKYFRRVFSRFDKSARNFIAFLLFVRAIVWLR